MAKGIAIAGLTLLSGLMITQTVQAQTPLDGKTGTITTAVPFLRISPGRAGHFLVHHQCCCRDCLLKDFRNLPGHRGSK